MKYPIKLDDVYPCRGTDADGAAVVFSDLLREGEKVGPWADGDEGGEPMYLDGMVVRRRDGLYVVAFDDHGAPAEGQNRGPR